MTDLFCVSGTSPTGVKQTDRPAEVPQFKCPACPDVFPSKGKRRSHVYEVHKTSYFCAEHGLLFADKSERDRHWTDVHGDALAPLVTEKQAEDFVLGIPHVASESDALLIAPDVLQSMLDDELGKHIVKGFGEAYGAAFEKLKPYVPYIREMKIRFSIRPRDKDHQLLTPIMGCSTWKEFCRTHLKRADSTIRELLAEPKSQLVVKPSVLNPDVELDQTVDQPAQQEDSDSKPGTPLQPSEQEHPDIWVEAMTKTIELLRFMADFTRRLEGYFDKEQKKGFIARRLEINELLPFLMQIRRKLAEMSLEPTPPDPPEKPPAEQDVPPNPSPAKVLIGDGKPITYIPDFLTQQEADALFEACAKLPFVVRQNPRNPTNPKNVIQHQVVTFLTNKSARAAYVGPTFLMSEAPKEIQEVVNWLTAEWAEGRTVTYASVVRYRDENDHMNWHQHREDKGHNTPILVVSTGGLHPCGFRVADQPETEEIIRPLHDHSIR